MKILFVNHVSYMSGAENSLLHLIRGLDRTIYDLFALCPLDGPLVSALKEHEVTVKTVKMGKRLSQFLRVTRAIVQEIRRQKIDLVHANSIDATQYCALPGRITHTLLVGHIRNIVPFRWHGLWLAKQATKLIAVSEATRRSLIEQGVPAERVELIYNGVSVEQFRPMPSNRIKSRQRFNVPVDAPLIGSVGRLHPVKGFDDFLEAARLVLEEIPNAHFAIAGSDPGPEGRYFEELIGIARRLGISDHIHFLGEIRQVELFLQGLDVFALPPLQEPFARAILEAMSCACPIVATAVGGTPEAIEDGHSGLLVSPARPCELASAVRRLLNDRDLALWLGRNAREHAVNQFSIEMNIERTISLYHQLISIRR